MNRRGFLSSLLKGAITAVVAPQIVTHGLKLKNGLWQREQLLLTVDKYNALPFYLARMEAKHFASGLALWRKLYDRAVIPNEESKPSSVD